MIPWLHAHSPLVAFSLLGGTLLLSLLALWLGRRRSRETAAYLRVELLHAAGPPFQAALWYYAAYFAVPYALRLLQAWGAADWFDAHSLRFWHLGLVTGLTWFLYRAVRAIGHFFSRKATLTSGTLDDYLIRFGAGALRTLLPLFGLLGLVSLLGLDPKVAALLHPFWYALFILATGRILIRATADGERTILAGLDFTGESAYAARGVQTRVRILRRFAVVFIGLVTVALLLLLIPGVDAVGKSLLASAGVAGIVLSFAAQQSLSTLFSGLQLALTQPIRLGDKVVTQGETGTIEEITSTYVVVRTWDRRGLVVPIATFISQPFQNLSRNAVSQTAVVKIRADFSLPVSVLREKTRGWVEASPLWDKGTFAFQVTDSDNGSLEIRVLASAAPDSAFDLQCQIRERLLAEIHERHNASLPGVRNFPPPTPAQEKPTT